MKRINQSNRAFLKRIANALPAEEVDDNDYHIPIKKENPFGLGERETVPIGMMYIVLKDFMPKPLTAEELRRVVPNAKPMR